MANRSPQSTARIARNRDVAKMMALDPFLERRTSGCSEKDNLPDTCGMQAVQRDNLPDTCAVQLSMATWSVCVDVCSLQVRVSV